jgi:hypothetical protein
MEADEIMVATPPQQVYNAVHPVAAQYGVPDPIWETVAFMESSYDPNATGDQGTSFGLFQLHQGGQLRTSPLSVMGTGGEQQNAVEAMPAIGGAWSQLKSSFNPSSLDWWTSFAAMSGHPGGGPGNVATQNAAQAMLNDYSSNNGLASYNVSATSPVYYQTGSNCPAWCSFQFLQNLPPCITCDPNYQKGMSQVNSIIGDVVSGSWWARVGVLLLGGILIIFGVMKLIK